MSSRIEDIDDFEVWWKYEQEGWTYQEIAEYYGVSISCIYWRLHPEKVREYQQTDKGKDVVRKAVNKYQNTDKGKEAKNRAAERYSKTEKGVQSKKRTGKRWWMSDKGKAYAKVKRQTDRGKVGVRKANAKRRDLGSIELNIPFPNSEGHHIDDTYIIHIPKELHHSIKHNVYTGEGMESINEIAFRYISEETFDKLIAGDI